MAAAVAILTVGLWPSFAFAGGSLDSSFGSDGMVLTDFGTDDTAGDVAVDGSGRIVVGGESNGQVAIARYLPTGALDLSFGGGDGLVTFDFGRLEDFFQALALDSADRIVIAATTSGDSSCSDCDFAVARLTTAGTLDPAFGGGDGRVVTDMGTGLPNYASDLAVDPSDRIVLAGTVRREDPPDFSDFAVVRYTEAGELDPTFGGDGRVTTDFDGVTQSGRAVALDGLGRIVVSGETAVGSGFALAAARYLDTGALDPSFSGDGRVVTDVAPEEGTSAPGLVIDGNNLVLLSGTVLVGPPEDLFLVRYLTDGTLDPAFGGGDGIALTPTAAESRGRQMAIDGAGRIVVVGSQAEQVYADVTVRRYLGDGSLDLTFGAGGLVVADLGTASSDYASSVALDAAGQIVIAGASGFFGAYDFAVARFLSEGAFVPPPKQPALPFEPPLGPKAPFVPPAPAVPTPAVPSASVSPPIASIACIRARKHVTRLRGKVKRATAKRQRAKVRSRLRQARAKVKRLC